MLHSASVWSSKATCTPLTVYAMSMLLILCRFVVFSGRECAVVAADSLSGNAEPKCPEAAG